MDVDDGWGLVLVLVAIRFAGIPGCKRIALGQGQAPSSTPPFPLSLHDDGVPFPDSVINSSGGIPLRIPQWRQPERQGNQKGQ